MHCYRAINNSGLDRLAQLRKLGTYVYMALLLLQVSCAAQQSTSNASDDSYYEDLTAARPKFKSPTKDSTIEQSVVSNTNQSVVASHTVNAKVDYVMDSLDKLNSVRKFVDGYTIQIYSGPNREDALAAKAKMVQEGVELEADIQYTQPKFRVTVGRYFSKLEAQKDLMNLKHIFSNAILVPEKIMIK